MNLYAFELGRKKELCLAELISLLGESNLHEKNLDTAIFNLKNPNLQRLQNNIGGTIKIMEVFAELPHQKEKLSEKIEKALETELNQTFKGHSGKVPFAINVLSYKNPRLINIKQLLNFSKFIFKNLGINSRFLNKDFRSNPKPSMIYKARAVEKGIDINVISGEKNIYLAKTISIQNIDNYSLRDYDKPKRDAKIGMLPPKLAQVLINLAGPNTKSIYDPFCGTGTILTEALLMGKDTVGSDISKEMTQSSQVNCEWLAKEFKTTNSFRIFTKDSRFLIKEDLPEKIDAIVTESYLGEPQSKVPSSEEKEKIFRELANLHLNWLAAINKITPKNCKIVTCVAAFRIGNKIEELPKFNEIAKLAGYKVIETLTYDRPDQIVARNIKVMEKL